MHKLWGVPCGQYTGTKKDTVQFWQHGSSMKQTNFHLETKLSFAEFPFCRQAGRQAGRQSNVHSNMFTIGLFFNVHWYVRLHVWLLKFKLCKNDQVVMLPVTIATDVQIIIDSMATASTFPLPIWTCSWITQVMDVQIRIGLTSLYTCKDFLLSVCNEQSINNWSCWLACYCPTQNV